MVAPLSVVISAFAPVRDVRNTLTPDLKQVAEETSILFVDLAAGKRRLGASVLAQCYKQMGDEPADMVSPEAIVAFSKALPALRQAKSILAYHDRSDGGIAAALTEMCIAGRRGVDVDLGEASSDADVLALMFAEELGVALQVRTADTAAVKAAFVAEGLAESAVTVIGKVTEEQTIVIRTSRGEAVRRTRAELQRVWAETSYLMQSVRDNEKCAKEEYDAILDEKDTGLFSKLTFDIPKPIAPVADAPHVAILREQGVNGHIEMAWAFRSAGFNVHDVHMSDVLSGSVV